ncbi:MAG TPA: hypothetical protein VK803_04350 [Steroidobacteraceae bacterium]|jgi:hypothetical protein|nr:hypothetical protein [Steroidobacteraceae bacterium]
MVKPRRKIAPAIACMSLCAAAAAPMRVCAQAGPPFLSNDPGTPGNGNWEINIAAMQTTLPGIASWQLPQLDVNYGVGERLQLTWEAPYVVQTRSGESRASGWGNANPGVKWRFIDQGEDGWQVSTFPMYQTTGSEAARHNGIAAEGPRLFLPLEVARKVGPLSLDLEVGSYLPWHGDHEHILGLVAGRQVAPGLELDAEIYDDHVRSAAPDVTTLDIGGRYKLHRGLILLFMAGRSVSGNSPGQVEFMGYLGIQILLSNYGRTLAE